MNNETYFNKQKYLITFIEHVPMSDFCLKVKVKNTLEFSRMAPVRSKADSKRC